MGNTELSHLEEWELRHNRPAEHASTVRATPSGTLIDADGDEIRPGEEIEMSFAGRPADMPRPWTLVQATNYFSTVNWKFNARVVVRAANGVEREFRTACVYSPRRPELAVAA